MSSTSGSSTKIEDLFRGAFDDGVLSRRSLQALEVVDVGAQIQAGLGVHVDDVEASEVVLVTMMPDDSGSIRFAGNADAVRDGHNLVLDALAGSKQRDGVLVHTRYLNGTVLFPYCPLDHAVRMTPQNYDPALGTPLYDQTVVLLGTVVAKAQELAEHGVATRTVTLLITDGADAGSQRHRPDDVAALCADLRRSESHIVAALGVEDGSTDFRAVFRAMGVDDRWILTARSDAGDLRRAFRVFSRSAVALAGAGAAAAVPGLGSG
jgi:hypothetical protein